jgi:hypothetical protein
VDCVYGGIDPITEQRIRFRQTCAAARAELNTKKLS